jgi:protein-disulfide isomerase
MKFLASKRLAAALALTGILVSIGTIVNARPAAKANNKHTERKSSEVEVDWLNNFIETEQGSFIMGHPLAPTKIVEYASYTCGHCATFEADDAPRLKKEKVASGDFNFEIRSLVRDPLDLTMAMLARCGGKDKFFGNHKFLMANQTAITGRANAITEDTMAKLSKADYTGFMVDAYSDMKLADLMQQRGISDSQAKTCLADNAVLGKLIAVTEAASTKYNVNSTPSFLVNDKLAIDIHNYDSLKLMLTAKKQPE